MGKTTAVILVYVAMMATLVAASFGRKLVGANDDALVLTFILILAAGSIAVSEVVAHYAKREESKCRRSHNPPTSG